MAAFGYKDRSKVKQKGPKLKSMILAPDGNKYPSTVDPQMFAQLADTDPVSIWSIEERPNEKGRKRSIWVEKKFMKKVVSLAIVDALSVPAATPVATEVAA